MYVCMYVYSTMETSSSWQSSSTSNSSATSATAASSDVAKKLPPRIIPKSDKSMPLAKRHSLMIEQCTCINFFELYVCMFCSHEFMHVLFVCMHIHKYVHIYVCSCFNISLNLCMYICMYVCTVCMWYKYMLFGRCLYDV